MNGLVKAPVSVMIFTLNEEIHLPSCLEALGWADDVIVVDSFSTDRTEAICRERGVRAVRASLLAFPFADRAFDAVTSFDVIYHAWVTDDRVAVCEMARVVRPGGLLLLRVPALRALWGAHDVEVQSHHRYTRAELVALLEGCGLRVERATYSNSCWSTCCCVHSRASTWAAIPARACPTVWCGPYSPPCCCSSARMML